MHEAVKDLDAARDALRQSMRARRAGLSYADLRIASEAVCKRVAELATFTRARCIGVYAAIRGEVDPLVIGQMARARSADIAYPRIASASPPRLTFHRVEDATALSLGRFGIAAPDGQSPPVSAGEMDLLFVPGLAFDGSGHRLGYGGGYYDATLAGMPAAIRIGLCHDFQLIDSIPHRPGDQPVDLIVTPLGARATSARPSLRLEEVLS